MAFLAAKNESYAHNLLDIVEAWATINQDWGLQEENGPLEAACECH